MEEINEIKTLDMISKKEPLSNKDDLFIENLFVNSNFLVEIFSNHKDFFYNLKKNKETTYLTNIDKAIKNFITEMNNIFTLKKIFTKENYLKLKNNLKFSCWYEFIDDDENILLSDFFKFNSKISSEKNNISCVEKNIDLSCCNIKENSEQNFHENSHLELDKSNLVENSKFDN